MSKKLAVFDIDGTIAHNQVLAPEAFAGIAHLQSKGYTTTVSTGRGYAMVKHVLGEQFDKIISDDALVVVEHGAKIVTKAGETFFADYFEPDTITHITDFMRANIEIMERAWVNPEFPHERVIVWCKDHATFQLEFDKKREYTDVFVGSIAELKERLLGTRFCQIGVKLVPHVKVENLKLHLTRSPISAIFQDGNVDFLRTNTNKGLAILYVMRHMGLDYGDVLVAGNAINDVEMLNLSVGRRVLVGPEPARELIKGYLAEHEGLTEVKSPADLGRLLQTL